MCDVKYLMIPSIISQENNIYIITIIVSHDQIIIIPDIADKMPIVRGVPRGFVVGG